MDVVTELGKHYPMESFGMCVPKAERITRGEFKSHKCAHVGRVSPMYDAEKECVFFYSKFALVLENTIEKGYVTEKLWQPLKVGAVPIMRSKELHANFLPHADAAIFIEDFASLKDLAAYLVKVSSDERLWKKHVAWKQMPVSGWSVDFRKWAHYSLANLPCNLCDEWVKRNVSRSLKFQASKAPPVEVKLLNQPVAVVKKWVPNGRALDACVIAIFSNHSLPKAPPVEAPGQGIPGIDKIYVMHWKKAVVRKQIMLNMTWVDKWQKSNYLSWIEAFDRQELSQNVIGCLTKGRNGHFSKLGMMSIAIKHQLAYWDMVAHNYSTALILEDDLDFREDWMDRMQILLHNLPQDWCNCMLAGPWVSCPGGAKGVVCENPVSASNGVVAYLMSLRGATMLLHDMPLHNPPDGRMDIFKKNYPEFKAFLALPMNAWLTHATRDTGHSWDETAKFNETRR